MTWSLIFYFSEEKEDFDERYASEAGWFGDCTHVEGGLGRAGLYLSIHGMRGHLNGSLEDWNPCRRLMGRELNAIMTRRSRACDEGSPLL